MRRRFAGVILIALTGTAMAADEPALMLDALPEIAVSIPSDPTEFAPPNARAILPTPGLPEVVVAIPREQGDERPLDETTEVAARAPTDAGDAAALPEPLDPNLAIAMLPERPKPALVPQALPATPAPLPPKAIVSAPVPAPVAAASMAPAPVAAALPADVREGLDRAFASLTATGVLPQPVLAALRAGYARRDDKAVFAAQTGWLAQGRAVLSVASRAADHGLDASRLKRLDALLNDPDAATREIGAAAMAVLYARDARGARINPRQVSALITATPTLPEAGEVIDRLAEASDAAALLEGYNPRHPGYLALKQKLAELRGQAPAAEAPQRLTFGPALTLGMSDPRVPLLREKLALPAGPDNTFDAALVEAIKTAQRTHGLKPTGRLDRRIVAALGGGPAEAAPPNPVADIIANMESWRWLPVELGATHVMVNVPAFWLTMRQDGAPVFETRVVVGKPNTPTPIFSHKMEFLVVNPSWNVPPSIAMKEYLPLLRQNPYALQGRGLQVSYRGRAVDPGTIDWATAGRAISIRQPPGERNALGHIKFMFPNEHAVYLHDTPSRGLFANSYRAYSHGCVRVQNPFKLAEMVLGQSWSEGRLRGMVGGGERTINLNSEVGVHIAYFTLEVTASGDLVRHADVYGHQRRLRTMLGL